MGGGGGGGEGVGVARSEKGRSCLSWIFQEGFSFPEQGEQ